MPNYVFFETFKDSLTGVVVSNDPNKFRVVDETSIHLNLYKRNRCPYLYFSRVNLLPNSIKNELSDSTFTTNSLDMLEIKHIEELELWDDEKFCEYVIQNYPGGLKYVRARTDRIKLMAVKKDGENLKYIEDQTPDLCIEAVTQNAMVLKYVKFKTDEICWRALERNIHAYNYIENPSNEMKLYVVRNSKYGLSLIKDQTIELCMESIEHWPDSIMYVKEPATEELLMKKLAWNGSYIHQIENPTREMVITAIRTCPFLLRNNRFTIYVTPDMLLEMVRINGNCLEYIDDQTFQICDEAVKNKPYAYQFIRSKEHRGKLHDTAYDRIMKEYELYNKYVDVYRSYINENNNLPLREHVKFLFSCFTIDELRTILSQYDKIYGLVNDKFCNYRYNEIKHFLEKYGVSYTDEKSYDLSLLFSELTTEHYILLEAISFNKTNAVMDVLSGNLDACNGLDMTFQDVLHKLNINQNGDIEFIDIDIDNPIDESDDHYYTQTYLINGNEMTVTKEYRVTTYEEANELDNFLNRRS